METIQTRRGDTLRAYGRALCFLLACATLVPFTRSQGPAQPGPAAARPAPAPSQPPPSAYAGDAACAECHRGQSDTYAHTPHALDSSLPSARTIVGDFSDGHNVLRTANPNLIVAMTHEPQGYFQSAINIADPSHPTGEVQRFDIVIGSGRHAQTYLYWNDDKLFELPVSYWQWSHQWVLSPGFPDGQVHFERAVVPRCLECHGSYFKSLAPPLNRFDKSSIVLGINCERCHGPAARHVALERTAARPASQPTHAPSDLAIINPAHLPRDRQLGLCALCHAGAVEPIRPPLTFIAGDNIHDFLNIKPAAHGAPVDVHGNQVGALEQSKCFRSSTMTCSTCHNVHETQQDVASFNKHCLTCHQPRACGRYAKLGDAIRTRCIDCHMPLQESSIITSGATGRMLHAELRVHEIAIYPSAAAKVENNLKSTR